MTLVNKLVLGLISSVIMITAATSVVVNAQSTTFDLNIPVDTIVRGDEGSRHVLGSEDVEKMYQGFVCDVRAEAKNQSSVHPGNDLVVASNGTSVTLEDVERAPGVTTEADGQLMLGPDVTVTLVMGPDKVFSGGINVKVTCEEKPEPIEVCRDGEVIEILPDERLPSDTNPPCPEEKIEVCRDGVVITIDPEDRRSTDTNPPCPKPEMIEVCREGNIIVIFPEDLLPTDTNSPCEVLPLVLPETGAGAAVAGLLGLGSVATAGRQWLRSRKALTDELTN